MDLISVVVPVYNVEAFLDDCVQSICGQTYRDIEIIIVDDGSTDSCPALCDEWALKDKRIKVVHKSNGGLSDARNAGIEIAQGKYITFVDSDDVVAQDMLEYLAGLLSANNADIAVCHRFLIDENGQALAKDVSANEITVFNGNVECMRAFLESSEIDTVAWGKLYKTSMFQEVRYPKGRFHEDVFTTYKLVSLSKVIVVGSARKYMYRIRKGSITQISFTEKHLDAIWGKEEQYNFIKENYPELKSAAQSGIVYACNQCVLRLAKSCTNPTEFISLIKEKYRKNIISYLRENNRLRAKLFALSCCLTPIIPIKSIRLLHRAKNIFR